MHATSLQQHQLTLRRVLRGIGRRLYELLPALVKAEIEYNFFRDYYMTALGGPLNGQEFRAAVVRSLFVKIPFDQIVETGTFRGRTTSFFADLFPGPIITIEQNWRFFLFARRILLDRVNVVVEFSDSRAALHRLIEDGLHRSKLVFFYLDAHWYDDLPLYDEMRIIIANFDSFLVVIDDFKVPGDSGYGFDDYGSSKALTAEYLRGVGDGTLPVYYPRLPASKETGARRGWAVIGRGPTVISALEALDDMLIIGDHV